MKNHFSDAKNNDWVQIQDIGILIEEKIGKNPEIVLALRQDKNFATMYSLMNKYFHYPFFFNSRNAAGANIFTNTNEIIGIDVNGIIYNDKPKVIVHTHGLYINSANNPSQSIENNVLSDDEFAGLLEGRTPNPDINPERVPVYKEEDLKYLSEKKRTQQGISVIKSVPEKNYLGDPTQYCHDLERIVDIRGFEENGLLLSRTWRTPLELMNFIKQHVPDFFQISPLIESALMNRANTIFEKYRHRVMPLLLREGAIIKKADDKIDIFDETSLDNEKYFLAIIQRDELQQNSLFDFPRWVNRFD